MSVVLTLKDGFRSRPRTEGMAHVLYPLVVNVHPSPKGELSLTGALASLLQQERDDIVVEVTASTARIYAIDEVQEFNAGG